MLCSFILHTSYFLLWMEWRTDLLSQRASRQYLRRCGVSRPGSGWFGVGPPRSAHAIWLRDKALLYPAPSLSVLAPPHLFPQGSPRPCAPVASTRHRASSSGRSPSRLLGGLRTLCAECPHLGAQFPLRCFQRFLLPDIATQPAGRPTTAPPAVRPRRSSRTERSSAQCTKRP